MNGRHSLWPWVLRGAAVLALWLAVAGPAGDRLLAAALPLQRTVYAALLPDFHVHRFALAHSGPHLTVQATAVSRRYLVMGSQVLPVGMGLDAQTPARLALTLAALAASGSLLLGQVRGRRGAMAAALAMAGTLALLCVPLPLILAGEQWGLGVAPFGEWSVPALLVGLSGLLLHGAGFGLAALVVLGVRWVSRTDAG